MNIGIDLDGVLTDIRGFYRFNRELRNAELSDTRDIFHCSDEQMRRRWKYYLLKYSTIQPARKGAKDLLHKLKKDGHRVLIITKRAYTCRGGVKGRLMRLLVRGWLMRNKILFQRIVFCDSDLPDSKHDACLQHKIDILVDDEPVNIYSVPKTVIPICLDARYNRSCVGENIVRAKGLDETYRIIRELASEYNVTPRTRRRLRRKVN